VPLPKVCLRATDTVVGNVAADRRFRFVAVWGVSRQLLLSSSG
jgi:hypothetical protein